MPAPASVGVSWRSRTVEARPRRARASARANPPMPPPTIRIIGVAAMPLGSAAGIGQLLRRHHAAAGFRLARLQVGGEDEERRAVGTEDLVVAAHVQIDV